MDQWQVGLGFRQVTTYFVQQSYQYILLGYGSVNLVYFVKRNICLPGTISVQFSSALSLFGPTVTLCLVGCFADQFRFIDFFSSTAGVTEWSKRVIR